MTIVSAFIRSDECWLVEIKSCKQTSLYDDGCYFSIWAPDAAEVVVHLYSKKRSELGYSLGQQKGGVWYGFIKGAKAGDCYALETRGTNNPNQGLFAF